MADLLDRITNRPVRTKSLTFALDPNDATRLADARSALHIAKAVASQFEGGDAAPATVALAATQLDEAQKAFDAIAADVVTFTVEMAGIAPSRIEELILEHPATPKQIKKARALNGGDPKKDPHVNEDDYVPALLAEAITRVTVSDDPDSVLTGLSPTQVSQLLAACPQDDKILLATTAESLARADSKVEDLGKG